MNFKEPQRINYHVQKYRKYSKSTIDLLLVKHHTQELSNKASMFAIESPNFQHIQHYGDFVPFSKSTSFIKELDSEYLEECFPNQFLQPNKIFMILFSSNNWILKDLKT